MAAWEHHRANQGDRAVQRFQRIRHVLPVSGMTYRRGLRAVAAAGVAAAALLAPVVPFSAPAAARTQPGFTVREGAAAVHSFPGIPNAYPRAFAADDAPIL